MINYKQILEAVNRGIKFALDDFEDQEELQGQVNSKVKHNYGTKEWLDLMNNIIDLGLPSGTLWCKYNLDCDWGKLNNDSEHTKPEDWYGKHYAWGELEGNKTNENNKIYFDWDNYKFGNVSSKLVKYNLTKYCSVSSYGLKHFTDNLTQLLPEDDVAYQNKKLYNFKFNIPTIEQFEELINYTTNYWVYNYDPNKTIHNPKDDGGIQGLNGRVFEGKNENQLFIPAAGFRFGSDICNVSSKCYVWSSSLNLDYPHTAYNICLYSFSVDISNSNRYYGYSIRPVVNL